jgi:hypothetical protein
MQISEMELEDIIFYENFHSNVDRGLIIYNHDRVFRQLDLGKYGIPDLVGVSYISKDHFYEDPERSIYITVYELKKGIVDITTIAQANRYQCGIKKYISERGLFKGCHIHIDLVLIGAVVDSSDDFMCMVSEYEIYCYKYAFDIHGISFEKIGTYNFIPVKNAWKKYGDLENLDFRFIHKNIYKKQISNG